VIAEQRDGGTPWHPHHIAERYSLFALIAMGEGVVGTVATMTAVVGKQGWTPDAALVCIAGTGLTFGIWWIYYMLPSAQILHAHRERSFVWGYAQIVTIAAIVAMGAGLHVAAYFLEHEARIDALATVLSVAVPVGVFLLSIYGLYYYMLRQFDVLHIWLVSASAGVVALAIVAALYNVDMAVCLIVLMFAPMVTVVGYEAAGHRHQADALAKEGAL
jgi:low temperature requirement protein LtrA